MTTLRRLGVISVSLAALVVPALTTPVAAQGPAAPTPVATKKAGPKLTVTPKVHVPGQAVRFRGRLPGVRVVHLESHIGRPGDDWTAVPRSRATTKGGRFDFRFPAPSMFNIRYRVVGSGKATRPFTFYARPQESVLRSAGSRSRTPFHTISPGSTYTVLADTTPKVRNGVGSPPAFPGRTLSLQERVGISWRTIQQTTSDRAGNARFTLPVPPSGRQVLRLRQERWTTGDNEIGWAASFPAYFTVAGATPPSRTTAAAPAPRITTTSLPRRGVVNASQRYGWGPSLFDFAWTHGEDFDSRPTRGTDRRGGWVETSDGTGRAAAYNGGLVLQSKLEHQGPGDLGTTTATMRGNARKTGRWEFRVQGREFERSGAPYRFRLELVPEGSAVTTCVPEGILVGGLTLGGRGLQLGVRSQAGGSQWKRTVSGVRFGAQPLNLAVEVSGRHITWFLDGKPVATTKDRRAVLGVPLVPRLSLVGQQREMTGSQIDSDWQRAWSLERGRKVRSGSGLKRSAYSASC